MRGIRRISEMPTLWDGDGKIHESILRAFHILEEVKYLLKNEVPAHVILELIEDMEERK